MHAGTGPAQDVLGFTPVHITLKTVSGLLPTIWRKGSILPGLQLDATATDRASAGVA